MYLRIIHVFPESYTAGVHRPRGIPSLASLQLYWDSKREGKSLELIIH